MARLSADMVKWERQAKRWSQLAHRMSSLKVHTLV